MLSREENDLLTRTGPGSPMGALMRRYWVPFLLAEELPEPDSEPLRVTLLGEQLVGFRDSEGRIGLVDAYCAHRRAPLFFGRNEQCGLRCVYHGWKYDVDGRCVDMPSEPPESSFKDKIRLKAYPCRERGGIIWTYMGPPETIPGLPELEFLLLPERQRYVTKRIQQSNWLQALEGGLDSSHISFLHRGNYRGHVAELYAADSAPGFEVRPADYGLLVAARRRPSDGFYNWRLTPWLMPWYMMIPYPDGLALGGHGWIPIDDDTCWTWTFNWRPDEALHEDELAEWESGASIHSRLIPGTFEPEANRSNDYQIDRAMQRSGASFTGIFGSGVQDAAIQEGMGAICDRTREHLGSSDAAVIAARRHLLRALHEPEAVLGLDPASHHVRAVDITLPAGVDFEPEAGRRMLVT